MGQGKGEEGQIKSAIECVKDSYNTLPEAINKHSVWCIIRLPKSIWQSNFLFVIIMKVMKGFMYLVQNLIFSKEVNKKIFKGKIRK